MSPGSRRASPQSAREVVELDRDEAMRLLASVDHGRVVFTRAALPAIRPVNHLVVDGRVIVRTRLTAKVSVAVRSSADAGVVVAYEADDLDPRRRTGWSVVVTGLATEGQRSRAGCPLPAAATPVGEHGDGHRGRDRTRDRHRHPHRC